MGAIKDSVLSRETITTLLSGETMHVRKMRERLALDCDKVAAAINRNPGIAGKNEIARQTGLTPLRVHRCLKHINGNESPYARVDYGVSTAKSGEHAGETVRGWWPMRYAVHQDVLDQADGHSSKVERGVRGSRLIRLAHARGLTTKQAKAAVANIEARLGVDVEAMTQADYDAFVEIVMEEVEASV